MGTPPRNQPNTKIYNKEGNTLETKGFIIIIIRSSVAKVTKPQILWLLTIKRCKLHRQLLKRADTATILIEANLKVILNNIRIGTHQLTIKIIQTIIIITRINSNDLTTNARPLPDKLLTK